MKEYEENIPLTKEELKKIIEIFKDKKFEEFEIHPHFYRDKFTNMLEKEPRHNVDLQELKKIYEKPELIINGFKRKGDSGYKYTLNYKESTHIFVKIGYFLDEMPMKIFQAIRIFRNLEKNILKRYGIHI